MTLTQTLILTAAKNIINDGTYYVHGGRGGASGVGGGYDTIGFVRSCIKMAAGDPNLPDQIVAVGGYTTDQTEALALSWGMQRIPAKEARRGDVIVFSTIERGTVAAIISEDCGSNSRYDHGKMIAGTWGHAPNEMFLPRRRRNEAAAFRLV